MAFLGILLLGIGGTDVIARLAGRLRTPVTIGWWIVVLTTAAFTGIAHWALLIAGAVILYLWHSAFIPTPSLAPTGEATAGQDSGGSTQRSRTTAAAATDSRNSPYLESGILNSPRTAPPSAPARPPRPGSVVIIAPGAPTPGHHPTADSAPTPNGSSAGDNTFGGHDRREPRPQDPSHSTPGSRSLEHTTEFPSAPTPNLPPDPTTAPTSTTSVTAPTATSPHRTTSPDSGASPAPTTIDELSLAATENPNSGRAGLLIFLALLLIATTLVAEIFPVIDPLLGWDSSTLEIPVGNGSINSSVLILALGILVFLTSSSNGLVRAALDADQSQPDSPSAPEADPPPHTSPAVAVYGPAPLKGGRWIGPLERIALTGLLLAGAYPVAAALIAAKGIIRFPEIQRDTAEGNKAEYFLVGSLVSWMIALGAAALLWFAHALS